MKDRIRKIMESQHMAQQTFAQFIEKSPATLSSIFNGRTRPTLDIVEAIKSKIPAISTDWLMFGRGPMYLDVPHDVSNPLDGKLKTSDEPTLDFMSETSALSNMSEQRSQSQGVERTLKNNDRNSVKYIDKVSKKITEIRVFYDDQTWESFLPKTSKS